MKQVYLTSEIFLEIPDDPDNVMMILPPEICEAAGLETGDTLEIKVKDEVMTITKKPIPKIYESPDGGKTVYSRNFGSKERELIKKLDEEN